VEAQCIDVEKIGEVIDLPEDHPRRRHAQTCPRCRSLVESYVEFMKAEHVEGSGLEKARGALDARIRQRAERWAPTQTSALSRAPWWRGLLKPAPLVAGLAAAIAAVIVVTSRGPEQEVLRDDATQSQPFSLNDAHVDATGAIRLSWTAMAGADGYEVRIYGPDLSEVYRAPSTTETSAVIDRAALPANLPATLDLTWRVYALSGGDEIEVSAPGSIRAP
jgi:hypothetical protein